MIVKDLIKQLQEMPQESEVFHLWDGEPRTSINIVYESKNGGVITSDFGQPCYSENATPKGTDNHGEIFYTSNGISKDFDE